MRNKLKKIKLILIIFLAIIVSILMSILITNNLMIDSTEKISSLQKSIIKNMELKGNPDVSYLFTMSPSTGGKMYCVEMHTSNCRNAEGEDQMGIINPGQRNRIPGNNGADETIVYSSSKEYPLSQYLVYAYSKGLTDIPMQNFIWGTEGYTENKTGEVITKAMGKVFKSSSESTRGRSIEWGNFQYHVVNNGTFPISMSKKGNEVLVDQDKQTITVGPYSISYNGEASGEDGEDLASLVYNELSTNGEFCKAHFTGTITLANGSNKDIGVEVLDEYGDPVSFPKFGSNFYIRYDVGANEDVKSLKPNLQITWSGPLKTSLTKYTGTTNYKYKIDRNSLAWDTIKNAMVSSKLKYPFNHVQSDTIFMDTDKTLGNLDYSFNYAKDGSVENDLINAIKECSSYNVPTNVKVPEFVIVNDTLKIELSFPFHTGIGSEIFTDGFDFGTEKIEVKPYWIQKKKITENVTNTSDGDIVSKFPTAATSTTEKPTNDGTYYRKTDDAYETYRRYKLDGTTKVYIDGEDGITEKPKDGTPYDTIKHPAKYKKCVLETEQDKTDGKYKYEITETYIKDKAGTEHNTHGCGVLTKAERIVYSTEKEQKEASTTNLNGFDLSTISAKVSQNFKGLVSVSLDLNKLFDGEFEDSGGNLNYQDGIIIHSGGNMTIDNTANSNSFSAGEINVDMYLGGNVWEGQYDEKGTKIVKEKESPNVGGIEVSIFSDDSDKPIKTIMSDAQGDYGFHDLNVMKKYYVQFRYNGMIYENINESSKFKIYKDIADYRELISTAIEIKGKDKKYIDEHHVGRDVVNGRFSTITGADGSYTFNDQNKKAYGYYSKIENDSQDYVSYTKSSSTWMKNNIETETSLNYGALRYCDILYFIQNFVKNNTDYNRSAMKSCHYKSLLDKSDGTKYEDIKDMLANYLKNNFGISNEFESIWNYYLDTLVTAYTDFYPLTTEPPYFLLNDEGWESDSHRDTKVKGKNEGTARYIVFSRRGITSDSAKTTGSDPKTLSSAMGITYPILGGGDSFINEGGSGSTPGGSETTVTYYSNNWGISYKGGGQPTQTKTRDHKEEHGKITTITWPGKDGKDGDSDEWYWHLYTIAAYGENITVKSNVGTPNGTTSSPINYEKYNFRDLYRYSQDQARNVDLGIQRRSTSDVDIIKDVDKVTTVLNQNVNIYNYNKKSGFATSGENAKYGEYTLLNAGSDQGLFDGTSSYSRPILSSDYFYDGTSDNAISDETASRELRLFVTYKITMRNRSNVQTKVNELVDYYDSYYYQYKNDDYYNINTNTDINLSPTENNQKSFDILKKKNITNVSTEKPRFSKTYKTTLSPEGYVQSDNANDNKPMYSAIFLDNGDTGWTLDPFSNQTITITFEQNIDKETNKIELVQDLKSGKYRQGDRNMVEILSYSTGNNYGLVDKDSIAGNLKSHDLDTAGNVISSLDPVKDRNEDDTDKAPNVLVYINNNNTQLRTISGYVFEDERNKVSSKAVIGNGIVDGDEKKVNGVTVELVQLIKNRNNEYKGERILNYENWTITSGEFNMQSDPYATDDRDGAKYDKNIGTVEKTQESKNHCKIEKTTTNERYYSGEGKDKIIFNNNSGFMNINDTNHLIAGDGSYQFTNVPAGDYMIRFCYGDTTQTVLVSDSNNEVNKALTNYANDNNFVTKENSKINTNEENKGNYTFTSTEVERMIYEKNGGNYIVKGLNEKSYNGQDYKSTIYEDEINQNDKMGTYNGVNGYIDTEKQNYGEAYTYTKKSLNGTAIDKNTLYYYNYRNMDSITNVSDAKDVYYYREQANNYGEQADNKNVLYNNRAEVLDSWEKMGTYMYGTNTKKRNEKQYNMLQELMEKTRMVAQSGLVHLPIENTTDDTDNSEKSVVNDISKDKASVTITPSKVDHLLLGLTERAKAQLKLEKKVANIKITLQNGRALFDSSENSMQNLYYSKHQGHSRTYDDKKITLTGEQKNNVFDNSIGYRLTSVKVSSNNASTPELIQAYIDDELLTNSILKVTYTLTVQNVGDVDYTDKRWYYIGDEKERETNIVKTDAKEVVDYVTNSIEFEDKYQTNKESNNPTWKVLNSNELKEIIPIPNKSSEENEKDKTKSDNNIDLRKVNIEYLDNLKTYKTIITTNSLSKGLIPESYGEDNNTITSKLVLTTDLSENNALENLIFNNLTEIAGTHNDVGRRMEFSIVGNQKMANQNQKNNTEKNNYSPLDVIEPKEIDSDSSQMISILPPTGKDLNKKLLYLVIITSLGIIITGILIILKKVLKNKENYIIR